MSPSYLYKVTTVGSSAVGKTSIILRYTTGKFREYYTPTLGADFSVKNMQLGDDKVRLQIWDLGSQDFLGAVRAGYYQGTRGVVYMFDVTRPETLEDLWDWKQEVDLHTKGVESLVVANKTDLDSERQITEKDGRALAGKFRAGYIETSVKLNEGVDDAFMTIAKAIRQP